MLSRVLCRCVLSGFLVLSFGCTTVEYGTGTADLVSVPKTGTTDPTNHDLNIQKHSAKKMELTEFRLLDKTGAGCAMGASLGSARAAQEKALKDSPNAPVVTYKYKVYGSDEVGGSHCGVIYREARGSEVTVKGDATTKGDVDADVSMIEYGFNVRNGYDYGNFSWGVELAFLFGNYKIKQYPINYYDPVSKQFFDRTAKYSEDYAVIPLEVFTTYSPEFLYGVGTFLNLGINLGTYADAKYSYGLMYSFGLGSSWLLQAKLRQGKYTAKIVGEKAEVSEQLAILGLSYLFGQD